MSVHPVDLREASIWLRAKVELHMFKKAKKKKVKLAVFSTVCMCVCVWNGEEYDESWKEGCCGRKQEEPQWTLYARTLLSLLLYQQAGMTF